MRDPSVQDMHPVYPLLDSVDTVFELGDHSASYKSLVDQFSGLMDMEF